jgi:hypothetical protein
MNQSSELRQRVVWSVANVLVSMRGWYPILPIREILVKVAYGVGRFVAG